MRGRTFDSRCLRAAVHFAAALAFVAAEAADAAPVLRKQVDQNGDFVLFGNALGWECATKPPQVLPLPPPLVGTVGACGAAGITDKGNINDTSPDIFWKSDWPAPGEAWADVSLTPTDARSTATLNLPPGATVTYARLYWAAMQPDSLDITGLGTSLLLERPGVLSQTVNSDQTWSKLDTGHTEQWYQSTADVTSLVSSLGAGAFRAGSLQRADGVAGVIDLAGLSSEGAFVAWAMVVFYQLPGEPMRNLALFDGFDVVSGSATADVSVSGFQVPSGFQAKLGVLAYEGDDIVTGDSLAFGGYAPPAPPPANPTQLSDAQNPANNFFNGTYSYLGTPVSQLTSAVERGSNAGDLPQLAGTPGTMSGVDIDVVDVTAYVKKGDTAARILAETSGDAFVLGALVTSISTLKPDFMSTTKSWQNLTRSGGTLAGDVVQYTIVATNTGNDPSTSTFLTDALPPGLAYVPGSITIDGVGKTDAQGDDTAFCAGGNITAHLGTGATPFSGGSLVVGGSATVTFRVVVDGTPGVSIDNQATVSAGGQSGNPQTSYPSHPPGSGSGPTVIAIDQCTTSADCSAPTSTCYTAPSPHVCVQPPVFTPTSASGRATAGTPVLFQVVLDTFYGSEVYDLAAMNSPGCSFEVELLADSGGLPGAVAAVDGNGDGVWETIATEADANGNGKPDFGPLGAPSSTQMWLRLTPPPGAAVGSSCSIALIATGASTGLAACAADAVTVIPPPPVIGSPASGSTVVSGTPTFSGTGSPGAVVTVLLNGSTSYGPIAVDSDGTWSHTLTAGQALADGSYTLSALQAQGGVTSEFSASATFSVNTTAPLPILQLSDAGQVRVVSLVPGGTRVTLSAQVTQPYGNVAALSWLRNRIPLSAVETIQGNEYALFIPEEAYPGILANADLSAEVTAQATGPSGAPTATVRLLFDPSGLLRVEQSTDRAELAPGDLALLTTIIRSNMSVTLPQVRLDDLLDGLEPAGPPEVDGATAVALETAADHVNLTLDAVAGGGAPVIVRLPVRLTLAEGGLSRVQVVAPPSGAPLSPQVPAQAQADRAAPPGCGCAQGGVAPAWPLLLILLCARRRAPSRTSRVSTSRV